MSLSEKPIIDEFSRLFYRQGAMSLQAGSNVKAPLEAHYCSFLVQKCPLDLWVYQEILWECQPDLIVEMGTASGGTTLFLAHVLDLIDKKGAIISFDIDNRLGIVPRHPRIFYGVGNSASQDVFDRVNSIKEKIDAESVMVILDDDHSANHVYAELELYAPLVTSGQYLIVEDTNVDQYLRQSDGPSRAVSLFLPHHPEFEVDRRREKFLLTWNPGGYLRRK
jgi:cephalosporin hydroxylase